MNASTPTTNLGRKLQGGLTDAEYVELRYQQKKADRDHDRVLRERLIAEGRITPDTPCPAPSLAGVLPVLRLDDRAVRATRRHMHEAGDAIVYFDFDLDAWLDGCERDYCSEVYP